MDVNELYDYALTHWGKPYVWGANGPNAFDCSGFVLDVLKKARVAPPSDLTAEGIYLYYKRYGLEVSSPGRGCLVFFGEPKITHVGWMIDTRCLISAAGGNKNCTSVDYAQKIGASVKLQPLRHYRAPVGFLLPKY